MSQLKVEYARGEVLADKYEVVEKLDETPLGIAYRVKVAGGTTARLLLIDPRVAGRDEKQEIIDAFKLARGLEHRSLLTVAELGQHAGVAFVVMEDFEGESLRAYMDRRKADKAPFSLREAAQITIRVLEAAQVSQDSGHVLRVIRPEYALVNERRTGPKGANVVLDVRFPYVGLWSLLDEGTLAEDEFTRGEAHYLAPELKLTEPHALPQSDVYSGAILFYELLCGSPPVGTYQLPRQRRDDLPSHVDRVIELALAPAPDDRYPRPADLAADVQRTIEGALSEDAEAPKLSWTVWALAAALVAAVAGVLYGVSRIDPFEVALAEDNALRKQVYEEHPRPDRAEVQAILAKHPPNMVYIPGGPFVQGRLAHEAGGVGGAPAAVVTLEPYLIDVFEYPNRAGAKPRYDVTWNEANRLCQEQGKRLCTADEFEKACRGIENYVFSYGDTFDSDLCGAGLDDIHLSGSSQFPDCKSSWGVYDISGNFREWTSSERGTGRYLAKGGLPQSAQRGTRCAYSTDLSASFGDPSLSFRCCRDVGAATWSPPKDEAPAGDDAPEGEPEAAPDAE